MINVNKPGLRKGSNSLRFLVLGPPCGAAMVYTFKGNVIVGLGSRKSTRINKPRDFWAII